MTSIILTIFFVSDEIVQGVDLDRVIWTFPRRLLPTAIVNDVWGLDINADREIISARHLLLGRSKVEPFE